MTEPLVENLDSKVFQTKNFNLEWRTGLDSFLLKFPDLRNNSAVDNGLSAIVIEIKSQNSEINTKVSLSASSGVKIGTNASFTETFSTNDFLFEDSNACESSNNRCKNGGFCNDLVGNNGERSCECRTGYSGDDCGVIIDNCENINCGDRGICSNGMGVFTCLCETGFTGIFCEIDNFCDLSRCKNQAECSNQKCDCEAIITIGHGFSGVYCEEIDHCSGVDFGFHHCSGNGQSGIPFRRFAGLHLQFVIFICFPHPEGGAI